nr:cytochrome P450 [Pharsalia antennata]
MLRGAIKLRGIGVKFISTNPTKRTTETISISKRDDYYKHLGGSTEKYDLKPPGWDEGLPFESIPGPKPLPIIGNMWRYLPYIGEFRNMSLRQIYQTLNDKYGKTVVLKGIPGRKPMVMFYDVNDMEAVLRNEGAFPIRKVIESVVHYRLKIRKDVFSEAAGVLSLQGEDWFKFRSTVNPILMQPRAIQQYVGSMDKVAGELLDNMRYFAKQNENSEMPENFQDELYKWALESVGVVALDRHLGCLNLNAPKDSEPHKFISNVNEMFHYMYQFDVLPPIWKFFETPSFKRYMKILDYITEITLKYVEESLNKAIVEDISDNQLSVIQRLAKINKKIATVMSIDMMMAGIDTTGKTLASVLYFLAKNPDKQQRLREEAFKNIPEKDSPITSEALNKSPYLKAAIKESNRIAPIAIANVRTTVKDLVLGGYKIPKDTDVMCMHLISANSDLFKDPEKFIPERWLRSTGDEYSSKNVHPFAYMPFGFGPRSCIGKRLANLEIEVVLAKIIRNFELSWPHEDMLFSGKLLYGIMNPLKVRIKEL